MKRQIRQSVFETNSSSTHSIAICSAEEYEKFKNGELAINDWTNKMMPISQLVHNPDYDEEETGYYIDPANSSYDNEYQDYETFMESDYLESYEFPYTTKSGDKIVAFGKYGHD